MSPASGSPPDQINLNPGPVPLAEPTERAMLGALVSHRSTEFEALHEACRAGLRTVFETGNELVIVNGNGNMGLELAVANGLHPDDRVLCLRNGKFGDNLAELISRHVDELVEVDVGWGDPFDLDEIAATIEASVDAVAMTHCETSTGMLNPVEAVVDLAKTYDAVSLVDGVSSVGGEPLPVDDWGIDMAVTASQKCLSAPPGVSAVALSERALERARRNTRTMPYNLDVDRYLSAAVRNQTPSTAPVHTYHALRQSLSDILDVGLEETISRRSAWASALRAAGRAVGMQVFPQPEGPSRASNTVTVLEVPEGCTAPAIVTALAERGLLVRTGIGPMREGTIRVATMSNAISDADIVTAIDGLAAAVTESDAAGPVDGAALEAARERLAH